MGVHGNPIFLLNYMENTILTDIICKVADRVKAAIKKQKFVKNSFYLKLLDTHVLSPSMKLTLSWWVDLSTEKFHPSASTRRTQLSVAVATVRSTDLLNDNIKTWVNTD